MQMIIINQFNQV